MVTSLKTQAFFGVKWTALSTGVSTGVQFLQLFILARLLDPTDFGLMAMVNIIIGFAQTYADLGVSAAIIQRQDITRHQLSSLYWLNVASGVLLFVLVCAVSPLATHFFHEPRIESLMIVVSLSFLITPLGVQFQMLLQRDLLFDILARQKIITSILGATATIAFAWYGYGVWALVWGQLSTELARTALLIQAGWRKWTPMFHFQKTDTRGYVSFGLYQMGERTINYFNSKLDQLLIGYLLGAQALGYYFFAVNLVLQPNLRINPILVGVAFPIFSKVQNDLQRLQRGYLHLTKMLGLINAPLLFGFAVVAPLAIPVLFGEQWLPAVTIVQILSVFAFFRSTVSPVGSLLLARGRADLGFKWNLAMLFIAAPFIMMGSRINGIAGVCWALLCLQLLVAFPNYWFQIRPLVGACAKDYFTFIIQPTLYAGVMAAGVLLLSSFLGHSFPSLAFEVLAGGAVYSGLIWIFDRRFISGFMKERPSSRDAAA